MNDFLTRLTSRKFLLCVLAILYTLGNIALGGIDQASGIETIKQLIIAYLAAEGAADTFGRFRTG